MSRIRVGLVGLSAAATGTGWATISHLPYLLKSSRYVITALCNSSVEAARKSVEAYDLPETTKTYGSPEDLANDVDVDLVVASVRVDKHAEVLLPSLKKGKDVFCEWPLDRNVHVAREMLAAAKEGGGKAFVALQGRQSPDLRKVKSLIESGRIGKVLSSTFHAALGNGGGEENIGLKYFTDRSVGGNPFTIGFGHGFDSVLYVLGELKQYSSILANQRPETRLVDPKTKAVVETVTKNTPDQVLIQGHFDSGAVLSLHFRGGKPFPSGPNLQWKIYGEKGEIAITAPGPFLSVGYDDTKIVLHDQLTDQIETVEIEKDEWDELIPPARNIARLYEASGKGEIDGVADFESAVKRHALIEDIYQHWDSEDQGRSI